MIYRSAKSSWYSLSTIDRSDYARKIHVEHVHYNKYNIGLGVSDKKVVEPIFHCADDKIREMPYKIPIQTAITYEMDSIKVDLIRNEYTLLDWFASIGGLGSIGLAIAQLFSLLESPHYFVTSAMIA